MEIKRNWDLRSVDIIPVIISAEGLVHKELKSDLNRIGLKEFVIQDLQKAVLLSTCHIIRKVLNFS